MNNTGKLDKTEEFVESIYESMDKVFHSKIKDLSISEENDNLKDLVFVKKLYNSFNNKEKELFSNFLKSFYIDFITSLLADFDGLRYTDVYPYEELKIICDDVELKPYLFETFLATFQEKNPDME